MFRIFYASSHLGGVVGSGEFVFFASHSIFASVENLDIFSDQNLCSIDTHQNLWTE